MLGGAYMKNLFLPQAQNATIFAVVGSPTPLIAFAALGCASVLLLLFFMRR